MQNAVTNASNHPKRKYTAELEKGSEWEKYEKPRGSLETAASLKYFVRFLEWNFKSGSL